MNLIDATKVLYNHLWQISQHFGVTVEEVKIDFDEVVFTVTAPPTKDYTDADFQRFCKENELNGVIFFNGMYAAPTFSMSPKRS